MRSTGAKLSLVAAAIAAAGVLIGFYVSKLSNEAQSAPYSLPVRSVNGHKVVNLEIETVAAIGPTLSPNPDWVSYLVHTTSGWKRETVWDVPANATIHVTVYNFDGASGLRQPFYGRFVGTVGNRALVDGKSVDHINPMDASHLWAVPGLGIVVAFPGVADNAKNQCGFAPCQLSNAHHTIQFTFRTTKPGHYRWQCFVPCAAGWMFGTGGPMATIGYMDGFLNVEA
jgi:hypothetical protein